MEKLEHLEKIIKERVPGFKIRFKDESIFMKFIGKLFFFNKRFMTRVTTTIGKTVYFPTKADFETYKTSSFKTLAHEYVHVMDYNKNPICFIIGYLFPQILSILSIFSFLASFFNLNFLFFLLFLLFLLPIPAPYRTWVELRGYSMSGKIYLWEGKSKLYLDSFIIPVLVDNFSSSLYYYMCPFKNFIKKKLNKSIFSDNNDDDIVFGDVLKIIKQHENL